MPHANIVDLIQSQCMPTCEYFSFAASRMSAFYAILMKYDLSMPVSSMQNPFPLYRIEMVCSYI